MTTQHHAPAGYVGLAPEQLQAIVRRAHEERKQALREFFAWVFRRRAANDALRHLAHVKVVACR
jgi:hypothetical protein